MKILSLFSLLALAALVVSSLRIRELRKRLIVPAAVFILTASLVLSRLIVISVVDATSFPAVNTSYLGPAIAMLPILLVLPLASLAMNMSLISRMWKTGQSEESPA